MNKINVGDKVRILIDAPSGVEDVTGFKGTTGTVVSTDTNNWNMRIMCDFDNDSWWFSDTEVERITSEPEPESQPTFCVGDIVAVRPNSRYGITTTQNGWVGKITEIDDDVAYCETLKHNDSNIYGIVFQIDIVDLVLSDYVPPEVYPTELQPILKHEIEVGDYVSTNNPIWKGIGVVKRVMVSITNTKTYLVSFNGESPVAFIEGEINYVSTPKKEEKKDVASFTIKSDGTVTCDPSILACEHVNHPNHYQIGGKYEVLDVMRDTSTKEEYEGFLRNNVLKYILRYKNKNGLEDLRKAEFYLNELIKTLDSAH